MVVITDILISARRGAGSSFEILYGTVTFKPTLAHARANSIVLPAPTTFDLVDGEVVAVNVQPTPDPVNGQIEWAYEVTFRDRHGKDFKFLVGVPNSTSQVNFNSLPRYYETKPPLFGQGPKGDPGEAATVSIGTVTSGTTPAVTNSGTANDAVLNFVLAKGDKGDRGDGVPAGGADKQVLQKVGTTSQWVDPENVTPLATPTNKGLLEAVDQRLILNAVPLGSANLNTVLTPGKYQQYFSAEVTLARNYPLSASSCRLEVYEVHKDALRRTQEITYIANARKFTRYTSDGGLNWTAWVETARVTDITNAIGNIPHADENVRGVLEAGELPRLQGYVALGNQDLDTLTEPGDYYAASTSYVTSANHYPVSASSTNISVRPISATRVYQYARVLVSARYFQRFLSSSGTWSAWVETVRASDLDRYSLAYNTEKAREYVPRLSNTGRFSGSPRLSRNGNSIELTGILVSEVAGGTGGSIVPVFPLPPDAIPLGQSNGGIQRWIPQYATGNNPYMLYISAGGNVCVTNLSSSFGAGSNVYLSASWNVKPASPYSFWRVCDRMIAGSDYTRTITDNGSWLNVMAPHGGEVEPGTSELAKAVRDSLGASWYEWDFLNTNTHGTTSFNVAHEVKGDTPGLPRFDDIELVDLVKKSDDCLGIHGCWDGTPENGRPPGAVSFIGGDNRVFALIISAKLKAAGFSVQDDPATFPGLGGGGDGQIHNLAKNRGVQIEMSETQRKNFFTNNDFSRSNRMNVTSAFTNYKNALVAAINEYRAL